MAISLVKKFSRKINNSGVFEIPLLFRQAQLIIAVNCQDCRKTWHKAGYISQLVDIFPLTKVRSGEPKLILLGNPQICNFALFDSGYRLQFELADWVTNLDLQIYEPNMSLYQSEAGNSNPQDVTSQSTPVQFALTIAPVAVLAANVIRKGILVRNKGNKPAALGFDNGVNLANAPYIIPAGATLELIEDFPTGQLFMMAPSGNTDVVVMEFL
jgi:hypothetical protein